MTENENNVVEETVSEQAPAPEVNTTPENGAPFTEGTPENGYSYTPYMQPQPAPAKELPPENMVAGIVGAFIFSLVGAVLYFIIYQLGYIAGICGLVTVVCAIKGYSFFGKRESIKGIVIAVVMSVVALLIAEYASVAYTVYSSFSEMYAAGEIDYTITLTEAFAGTMDFILSDSEVTAAVVKDIAIMLGLSALGAFSSVRNAIMSAKANKQ